VVLRRQLGALTLVERPLASQRLQRIGGDAEHQGVHDQRGAEEREHRLQQAAEDEPRHRSGG
jgi:hypothetical protein